MTINTYDVAIVGYGPVGKTLAILLAQKGWKIGIFEKHDSEYTLPRAVHMDDEIARILQSVIDMVAGLKLMEPVQEDMRGELKSGTGETLKKLPFRHGITGWPGKIYFHQPLLEKLLSDSCKKYNQIDIFFNYEITDVYEKNDHVTLIAQTKSDGKKEITARYVIGADGANSIVREKMNPTTTDLGFSFDWLVVDVIPDDKERKWGNFQYLDPNRPTTVVSGGIGRRRFEFMKLPHESIDELNREETAWELLRSWDLTPENAKLERHTVYTFKAKWVNEWRKNKMMLAGDAAHLTPPFLGQGLCAGLRDAKNLAWKLDLVLQEKVEEDFLETYTLERIPPVKLHIELAVELGDMICITDKEKALQRDKALVEGNDNEVKQPEYRIVNDGIISTKQSLGNPSLNGQLFIQSEVSFNNKTGLYDDVVGQGWNVIIFEKNEDYDLSVDEIEFLKQLGANIVTITKDKNDKNNVIDLEGEYIRFMEEHKLEAIIVRPDYYIFGSASSPSQLHELINELREKIYKDWKTSM